MTIQRKPKKLSSKTPSQRETETALERFEQSKRAPRKVKPITVPTDDLLVVHELIETRILSSSDGSGVEVRSSLGSLQSWDLREMALALRNRASWHEKAERAFAGLKLRAIAKVLEVAGKDNTNKEQA